MEGKAAKCLPSTLRNQIGKNAENSQNRKSEKVVGKSNQNSSSTPFYALLAIIKEFIRHFWVPGRGKQNFHIPLNAALF